MNEPMALADRSGKQEAMATPMASTRRFSEFFGLRIFWNYLLDTIFIFRCN
ncbi:hypothetical protein [Stappia sp.]|jgi:hypothetical protein|uniref:hypothetical protein n=1 Tax=Stappia sp. TaxID=1870903 RepID=UPI003D135CF2